MVTQPVTVIARWTSKLKHDYFCIESQFLYSDINNRVVMNRVMDDVRKRFAEQGCCSDDIEAAMSVRPQMWVWTDGKDKSRLPLDDWKRGRNE